MASEACQGTLTMKIAWDNLSRTWLVMYAWSSALQKSPRAGASIRRLAGCVHTWYPRPESELLWRMHDFVLLFRLHVVYMGFSMIWRRGQHAICSDQGPLCNVYIKRVSRPYATISWIRGSILFLAQ
ncbi:hypothetical protein VNO77_20397 [Canavalia gladiata]|uniref:Uncharacterized protein n=1 Tax=Canavalia gladiata TaxID=3824 RepID=A0AAN9LQ20_CANGL